MIQLTRQFEFSLYSESQLSCLFSKSRRSLEVKAFTLLPPPGSCPQLCFATLNKTIPSVFPGTTRYLHERRATCKASPSMYKLKACWKIFLAVQVKTLAPQCSLNRLCNKELHTITPLLKTPLTFPTISQIRVFAYLTLLSKSSLCPLSQLRFMPVFLFLSYYCVPHTQNFLPSPQRALPFNSPFIEITSLLRSPCWSWSKF